jgi:hypothetical protein
MYISFIKQSRVGKYEVDISGIGVEGGGRDEGVGNGDGESWLLEMCPAVE